MNGTQSPSSSSRKTLAELRRCTIVSAKLFQFLTELCRFSGHKIYPGRGIRFIRSDSQVFLFINSKCKHYFHNKLKPSKHAWTKPIQHPRSHLNRFNMVITPRHNYYPLSLEAKEQVPRFIRS